VQYGAGLFSLSIGQRLLTILRGRIFTQIQRLNLAYHWRHGVGEMVTRMTRDADKVRDALINFWRDGPHRRHLPRPARALFSLAGGRDSPWLAVVPLALLVTGIGLLWREADALVALDRRNRDLVFVSPAGPSASSRPKPVRRRSSWQ